MRNNIRNVSPFANSERSSILCEFIDKVKHNVSQEKLKLFHCFLTLRAMNECAQEMEDCYTEAEFQDFTEKSYQVLAKILEKFEADFSLSECNGLATPVPLTDLTSGVGRKSPTSLIFAPTIVISFFLSKLIW